MSASFRRWSGYFVLFALLVLVAEHALGVLLDFRAALHYPFELDYGEGIVWQQLLLIPGPEMYSRATDLPFIVFHYPPLYYLVVRAMRLVVHDPQTAGRLVSMLCTLAMVPGVAGLVRVCCIRRGQGLRGFEWVLVLAAAALPLCLHAVRAWGMLMRVDMLAIMLGMAGLLVAAVGDRRTSTLVLALLLCAAAMFAKQTQFAAGAAVLTFGLLRNRRGALVGAGVAGSAALASLMVLQAATDGGFLHNVVGYNINRMSLRNALDVLRQEWSSTPVVMLACYALLVWVRVVLRRLHAAGMAGPRGAWAALQAGDRATAARFMVLVYVLLSGVAVAMTVKQGANYNYTIELLLGCCVVAGILMIDLTRTAALGGCGFHMVGTALVGWLVVVLPLRLIPDVFPPAVLQPQANLVRRIDAAPLPVASADMTLLMRAGKRVQFEPQIVTELAAVGRWNEQALVDAIRARQFAFFVTKDAETQPTDYRSPAVNAALQAGYPVVEAVTPWLFVRRPLAP